MKRKALASIFAIVLISALSGTGAQAATKATVGGLCSKAGLTTMISAKSYTCTKVLSGKLVWVATSTVTAKPQIAGGHGDGGPGDDHGANDAARQAAFKAYNTCLVSHGGVAITPQKGFHPEGGPDDGVKPITPPVQPTLSAAQKKAEAACVALAPKFGPGTDH